jgi:putative ABC transport system permease protein
MLLNYLKVALVVFARRKVFTAISLVGITFTLTILLAATAVLDHIFGSQSPEVHQSRTLGVYSGLITGQRGTMHSQLSRSFLERNLEGLPGAEKVSIIKNIQTVTSFAEGRKIESYLKLTDADFWEILDFSFVEGRAFTVDEVDSGAAVAVINRATRERFFPGRPAIDETIDANGKKYRVIGVVENVPFFRLVPFADIWAPTTTDENVDAGNRVMGTFMGIVLARHRGEFAKIRQEFVARVAAADLSAEGGFDTLYAVPETPFQLVSRMIFAHGRSTDSHASSLLLLVVVLMVLFMVLPAVNLVNLNISRIMERSSEIGVRKAFGAPSFSLIGQFIVENVVLTLAGAVLSVVLAFWALHLFSNTGLIPYATFRINPRVLVYAVLTALAFGLISGVYPAWRMSRMHPVDALRGGAS